MDEEVEAPRDELEVADEQVLEEETGLGDAASGIQACTGS